MINPFGRMVTQYVADITQPPPSTDSIKQIERRHLGRVCTLFFLRLALAAGSLAWLISVMSALPNVTIVSGRVVLMTMSAVAMAGIMAMINLIDVLSQTAQWCRRDRAGGGTALLFAEDRAFMDSGFEAISPSRLDVLTNQASRHPPVVATYLDRLRCLDRAPNRSEVDAMIDAIHRH